MKDLVSAARKFGADEVKAISTKDIIIDKRVRLKCGIPVCSDYGRHLLCPPNLMSVDEFSEVVGLYKRAIIVQVVSDVDSLEKSNRPLDAALCESVEKSTNTVKWERRLHDVVNRLETHAFKKGFYLAAGLIGGSCSLCRECVTPASGERCRHPFQARPSMEAMGMDVVATCKRVGLPLNLSSSKKVRWTGLVLLD